MANELIIRHGLISKGGVRVPFTEVNNQDYSVSGGTDYYVEVNASSADRTITLPTPLELEGQIFVIKNKYNSNNKVIVATVGSETIDGSSTVTLSPSESLEVSTNGTNWTKFAETGQSLGAGCYDTDIETIDTNFNVPSTNKITVWNQVGSSNLVAVNKTQNGIDISQILLSFEQDSGIITITDSSDNFCSFTPQTIGTGSTYVTFTQVNSLITGTLPEDMDLLV